VPTIARSESFTPASSLCRPMKNLGRWATTGVPTIRWICIKKGGEYR